MRLSPTLTWLLWLASLSSPTLGDNKTQPISVFRSRPDLVAPILTTFTRVPEKQAPGYYFVSPYQLSQETVNIYDNDANLVYSGFGNIGPGICHAPQTCMYKGEVHLCFYQGTQMIGWGHGHGVILDKHYRVVKSVEPASYQASSDMHEFLLIEDGKSALMTQYLRSPYDLCGHGLCDGMGYIQQGAFQEIDVESGAVKFEWESLEHVDPSESYVGPSSTEISGSGEDPQSPWDYFHINSVDKNVDGDYLISARHTSAVYKISGKDGHIIWRLNGAKSDYKLDGFQFSFQHDARWISDSEDWSVISLFDNGSNGYNVTQPHSTGLIIRLDHRTKVATSLLQLDPPIVDGHSHSSRSQGNMQRLSNGNTILGWGSEAFWTEYAGEKDDYEIVFYGTIGYEGVMNYRVHKFDNWVGMPLTKPALWTYSKEGSVDDSMAMYVSWNGATEVKQWRFYTAEHRAGPWNEVATVAKTGFETLYKHQATKNWTYAEALDHSGHVLGSSAPQLTFIPTVELREYCNELVCDFMPTAEERQRLKDEAATAAANGADADADAADQDSGSSESGSKSGSPTKTAIIYSLSFGGFLAVIAVIIIVVRLNTKNNEGNSDSDSDSGSSSNKNKNTISRSALIAVSRVWDGCVVAGRNGKKSTLEKMVGLKGKKNNHNHNNSSATRSASGYSLLGVDYQGDDGHDWSRIDYQGNDLPRA